MNNIIVYPSGKLIFKEEKYRCVIGKNGITDDSPIPGKGSAIFMHVARPTYSPTAGCIALATPDLLEIIENLEKDTMICVEDR